MWFLPVLHVSKNMILKSPLKSKHTAEGAGLSEGGF
jgi:hypothetical protein